MAERLDTKVNRFLTVDIPATFWGLGARLDVFTNEGWDSLVIGTYIESLLRGKISPVRQKALEWLSSKDQALAQQLKIAGLECRHADVPTQTELVNMSRARAQVNAVSILW